VPALKAQKDLAENNGARNTWFCGAWMKNGFHEDVLASAIDVVNKFSKMISVKVAAQ
jgi:predicted NAD/FAD-binding protein